MSVQLNFYIQSSFSPYPVDFEKYVLLELYIQIEASAESDGEQAALEDLVAKDRDPAPGSSSRSFKATLKGTCRNRSG
jgi:hypothetical protein